MTPDFPELPIITPDSPRRSQAERYGGLFYLGLGGLIVLIGLLGWFAWNAWVLREVWTNIYTLNNPNCTEAERVTAAWALSRDPGLNQRQRWDLALSRVPPMLARYVLAESLTAEAVGADPSAYALAVARSDGWPVWLRLLLMRPMAYDNGRHGFPIAPLAELREHPDPAIRLWAAYIQAVARDDDEAAHSLKQDAISESSTTPLAVLLRDAMQADPSERPAILDRATLWLRTHHPDAARLWDDWAIQDGRLVSRKPRR